MSVQIILEMIEVREVDTARALLRTQVFLRVKQEEPDRFLRLEHLCGRTYLDIRCLHASLAGHQVKAGQVQSVAGANAVTACIACGFTMTADCKLPDSA